MTRSARIFYKWLGVFIAALIAIASAIVGWAEETAFLHIIVYSIAVFCLVLWGWHHCSVSWFYPSDGVAVKNLQQLNEPPTDIKSNPTIEQEQPVAEEESDSYIGALIRKNKAICTIAALLLVALIATAVSVDGFFTGKNIFGILILLVFIALAAIVNRRVTTNKSAFIGITVLIGLFLIGSLVVEGFLSTANIRSMLVFSAFLGLACIGQTLVALLGGLDLSIPFVIGSSNIGLLYILGLGVPSPIAIIIVLLIGAAIGIINGFLSFKLQGQALILTLGVGFSVSGGTQILTSLGSDYSGNVFGTVPGWLTNIAAMNGKVFGLGFPPVILIWILAIIVVIFALRNTVFGRNLYALGGSRVAAARLSISERKYWVTVYAISGFFAALTGILLLGWSGGGFIGVGDPYLFMTLAAVVVGGTSLLGGWGGYGYTVIGVLVLQILTSFLVGIGLSFEGQQFVFGLLILPMVALYARSPHIRTQI